MKDKILDVPKLQDKKKIKKKKSLTREGNTLTPQNKHPYNTSLLCSTKGSSQ